MVSEANRVQDATAGPPDLGVRYAVVGWLGAGSSAEVWAVEDRIGGGRYAAKVERPGVGEGARGALGKEYVRLRWLRHPNVVGVVDVGRTGDGRRFVVSERVGGASAPRWEWGEAMEVWLVVAQLVEAVGFVHERGLVHRDIHPENVRIEGTGRGVRVRLLDFGLAAPVGSGGLVGRPGYVAPEVMTGRGSWSESADYYGVGAVVYEIVTGRRPFDAGDVKALLASQERGVEVEVGLELSRLGECVKGLLSPEPGERVRWWGRLREEAWRRAPVEPVWSRAWALARIESVGRVGKGRAYQRISQWVERVTRRWREGPERPVHRGGPPEPLAIVGEQGAGKSVAVREIHDRFRLAGGETIRLGQQSEYPGWMRIVRGGDREVERLELWARTMDALERSGGAVLVDGVSELTVEERGFVEFAYRRMRLSQDGRVELVLGDRDPGEIERLGAKWELGWSVGETVVLRLEPGRVLATDLLEATRGVDGTDTGDDLGVIRGWDCGVGEALEGLRRGILEGALTWRPSGLQVTGALRPAESGQGEYVLAVRSRVSDLARSVMDALACGARTDEEIAVLVDRPVDSLKPAIRELQEWEVVQRRDDATVLRGRGSVRALREAMDERRRATMLQALVHWLESRRRDAADASERLAWLDREITAYEALGCWREALRRYVALVVGWRRLGENQPVRDACRRALDRMRGPAAGESTRHRRMAFVKAWVDVAWQEETSGELVEVVRAEYGSDVDTLPPVLAPVYVWAVREVDGAASALELSRRAVERWGHGRGVSTWLRIEHAGVEHMAGHHRQAREMLDAMRDTLPGGSSFEDLRWLWYQAWTRDSLVGFRREWTHAEAFERVARAYGRRRWIGWAKFMKYKRLFSQMRLEELIDELQRAETSSSRDEPTAAIRSLLMTVAHLERGEFERARHWAETARVRAVRRGATRLVVDAMYKKLVALKESGDFGAVLAQDAVLSRLPEHVRNPFVVGPPFLSSIWVRVVLREPVGEDELRSVERRFDDAGSGLLGGNLALLRSTWHQLRGEWDASREAVLRALSIMESRGDEDHANALVDAVRLHLLLGSDEPVGEMLRDLRRLADRLRIPRLDLASAVLRMVQGALRGESPTSETLASLDGARWERVPAVDRLMLARDGFRVACRADAVDLAARLFEVYHDTVGRIASSVDRDRAERFLEGERIAELLAMRSRLGDA